MRLLVARGANVGNVARDFGREDGAQGIPGEEEVRRLHHEQV